MLERNVIGKETIDDVGSWLGWRGRPMMTPARWQLGEL